MPGGGISRCRRSNGRGLVERIRFQWHAVDRWTRGRDDVEGGATTVEDGESLSEPHLLYDFLQALPQLFGADGLRHCDTPFQVRPKIITPEADGLAEGRRAEPRGRHLRSGTWRYARRRSLQTVSRRCRPLAPLACWRRAWRLGAAASVPYRRADQFQWNPVDRLIPGLIEAAACPRAGRRFNEAGAGSPRNRPRRISLCGMGFAWELRAVDFVLSRRMNPGSNPSHACGLSGWKTRQKRHARAASGSILHRSARRGPGSVPQTMVACRTGAA